MLNVYPTIITSLSDIFSTLQENKMVEIGFTFVIKLKKKKKKRKQILIKSFDLLYYQAIHQIFFTANIQLSI